MQIEWHPFITGLYFTIIIQTSFWPDEAGYKKHNPKEHQRPRAAISRIKITQYDK